MKTDDRFGERLHIGDAPRRGRGWASVLARRHRGAYLVDACCFRPYHCCHQNFNSQTAV